MALRRFERPAISYCLLCVLNFSLPASSKSVLVKCAPLISAMPVNQSYVSWPERGKSDAYFVLRWDWHVKGRVRPRRKARTFKNK
jgi:hypothetical protein